MSTIDLRIELPAYSHSFDVHVSSTSTINEVKQEISTTCPGQPRIDGQRLIWRGRILQNEERIADLWKSSTDSRILHLAVHPSAWTTEPPKIPTSSSESTLDAPLPSFSNIPERPTPPFSMRAQWHNQPRAQMPFSIPTPTFPGFPSSSSLSSAIPITQGPMPYITLKHQNAIQALLTGTPPPPDNDPELRSATINAVERVGWSWPAILDAEYPPAASGGVKYERVSINGQPYLSLLDPNVTPTPIQLHALKVLSYTFTLLDIHVTATNVIRTISSSSHTNIPPHINQLLQQYGLPPLRVANRPPNPNPGLRELPLRPLLVPLMLLLFRTALLFYFVAPARKPIFGMIIVAWMLYEMWRPIRNGLMRGMQRAGENNLPANPNNAAGNPVPPLGDQPPAQRPVLNAQPGIPGLPGRLDMQPGLIIDNFANMNLAGEEQIINQAHVVPVAEPGLGHKIMSFFGLMFSTLHPAIWNRRRAALRRREGLIRTEANARNAPLPEPEERPEGEGEDQQSGGATGAVDNARAQAQEQLRARHARRPAWIQRYMERVVAEEWVDDAD